MQVAISYFMSEGQRHFDNGNYAMAMMADDALMHLGGHEATVTKLQDEVRTAMEEEFKAKASELELILTPKNFQMQFEEHSQAWNLYAAIKEQTDSIRSAPSVIRALLKGIEDRRWETAEYRKKKNAFEYFISHGKELMEWEEWKPMPKINLGMMRQFVTYMKSDDLTGEYQEGLGHIAGQIKRLETHRLDV